MRDTRKERTRYAAHIANGECPRCGTKLPSDARYKNCETCRQHFRKKRRRWKKAKDVDGACTHCHNPHEKGLSRCRSCIDKSRLTSDVRNKRLLDAGLCFNCGQNPHMSSPNRICQLCYLKRLAGHAVGTQSLHKELLSIFNLQNGKCSYTGETLTIGLNASIDHICPRSRFPEKSCDLDNLEWTTFEINFAKRDLTRDEFLTLVRRIISYT